MSSSSSDEDDASVVIELGSQGTRVQFAGEDAPIPFLTCNAGSGVNVEEADFDYGAKICDEKLEYLVNKSYEELSLQKSKIKECGVIFIEPLGVLRSNRELVLEMMMETFGVPTYYAGPSPIMALYASGRGSGTVIQCGHSFCETITIYEGYQIPGSLKSSRGHCGKGISRHLNALLEGHDESKIENIKRDIDLLKPCNQYTLPDGSVVSDDSLIDGIKTEMFGESGGIAEMAYHAIMSSDIEARRHIFVNVILSGGTTLMGGFPETLQEELCKVARPLHADRARIKTVSSPERKYSSWIGGSIVGSLSCYKNAHISKEMYEESGPSIIHKYMPYGEVELLDH